MSLSAWMRFVELSLLAGWAAWRLYRPGRLRAGNVAEKGRASGEALLPLLAAILSLAQLFLAAQAATDPFTSLTQVLPLLVGSPYGALSAALFVVGLAAAVWLWLGRKAGNAPEKGKAFRPAVAGAAVLLLVCGGVASTGAADAVTAASSTGELSMSPTLAVPRSTLTTPNPYANDPASAARGRTVYQQYCLACHGLNGDGNGPAVAGLRIHPPSFRNPQHFLAPGMDGAHFWVVQHGDGTPGGMPAWQGTLTDQQMWDAVNYVKAIAAGDANRLPAAPPAPATASSGSSRPGG